MTLDHWKPLLGASPRVLEFASPIAALDAADASGVSVEVDQMLNHSGGFYGKHTGEQMRDRLLNGDPELTNALRALDKLIVKYDAATIGKARVASYDTGALIAPLALSGNPRCFRYKKRVPLPTSELVIAYDVGVSGSVTPKEIQTRGLLIAAAAKIISRTRPVRVQILDTSRQGSSQCALIVNFKSTPLNVNKLLYAMSSARFTRGVMMHSAPIYEHTHSLPRQSQTFGLIGWVSGMDKEEMANPKGKAYRALKIHNRVHDLAYFGPAHAKWSKAALADPVAWLQDFVAAQTSPQPTH